MEHVVAVPCFDMGWWAHGFAIIEPNPGKWMNFFNIPWTHPVDPRKVGASISQQ